MRNEDDLLRVIKRAAMEAVKASMPTAVVYGKVTKTEPLTVQLDAKRVYDDDFLVLTKAASDASLSVGDKVAMIREDGGQRFLILDKVV